MNEPNLPNPSPWDNPWPDFTTPNEEAENASSSASADEPADEGQECWRCGKWLDVSQRVCIYCRALLVREETESARAAPLRRPTTAASSSTPVLRLVWLFTAFLATSIVFGWYIQFGIRAQAINRDQAEQMLYGMLAVELVDAMLLLVGFAWLTPSPLPHEHSSRRTATWVLALPILGVLLALNFGYFWLLTRIFGVPQVQDQVIAQVGLNGWVWLAYCVQPAVVEEYFFRYHALGTLRQATGLNGAVWISAVMFGVAHIFNPLGVPYLVFVGVVLGYVRAYSGSMALPIVLHFVHNAAVILIDA